MSIIQRHPERFIGAVGAILVIVATQLLDKGLVTSDTGVSILHFIAAVVPLVVAEIIKLLPVVDG